MIKKISELTGKEIASICDHTFLNRAESYREKAGSEGGVNMRERLFLTFLEQSAHSVYKPYAVCVRPEDVKYTREYMNIVKKKSKTNIMIASVVGFPDGSWYPSKLKIAETELALEFGADEIDFVINYKELRRSEGKPKTIKKVEEEVQAITYTAHNHKSDSIVKMILEISELNKKEIITACRIAGDYGVDFVKTSSGFSAYGATEKALKIMKDNFEGGIKISAGVNLDNYKTFLKAASRRSDDMIDLNPEKIRIGESSLLSKL